MKCKKWPWKFSRNHMREKFLVYVKIFADLPRQNYNKTRLLPPWKWKSYPWKNHRKCPWKTQNVREKVCVKKKFRPWKKLKKSQKWLSRALLIITWKKNNTGDGRAERHYTQRPSAQCNLVLGIRSMHPSTQKLLEYRRGSIIGIAYVLKGWCTEFESLMLHF